MSRGVQRQIAVTSEVSHNNLYAKEILKNPLVFCEKQAPLLKGFWRKKAFKKKKERIALDLEIGIGKGSHLVHYGKSHKDRLVLGVELRFKILIQSLKKVTKEDHKNIRLFRYNASFLDDVFDKEELDCVMIYFPDPWPKRKHLKHRLIHDDFLTKLSLLQKKGAKVFFKTDSLDYFEWVLERVQRSSYKIENLTYDLKISKYDSKNFITEFERIFRSQNIPIKYFCAIRT